MCRGHVELDLVRVCLTVNTVGDVLGKIRRKKNEERNTLVLLCVALLCKKLFPLKKIYSVD